MRRVVLVLVIAVFVILSLSLYAGDGKLYAHMNEGHKKGSDTCTGTVRYTTHIRPIFDQNCAFCHGAASPEHKEFMKDKNKYMAMGKGPRMDSYTYMLSFIGWPETASIMRKLDNGKNTEDGRPGNMYQYLGSSEEERQKNLDVFREWVGYWTPESWKEITKEAMSKCKLQY